MSNLSATCSDFHAEPSPGRVRVHGSVTIKNTSSDDLAIKSIGWDANISLALANIGGGGGVVPTPDMVLVPDGEHTIQLATAAGARRENFQEAATVRLVVTVDLAEGATEQFIFSSKSAPGGADQPLTFVQD